LFSLTYTHKPPDLLLQYWEAELKYAHLVMLAMLASVGWVMSELLLQNDLADLLGKDYLLQEDAGEFLAKAPSVLNGGLTSIPPFFWVVTLLFSGVVEATRMLSDAWRPLVRPAGLLPRRRLRRGSWSWRQRR